MKDQKKYNKYYYEEGRNGWTPTTTWEKFVSTSKKLISSKINPKMLLTKEDLKIFDSRVPDYYKGKNGYEARKVCDNFDLTYHLATATTYILRAYHKHDTPVDCLTKAIAHLEFELDKIKNEKTNL